MKIDLRLDLKGYVRHIRFGGKTLSYEVFWFSVLAVVTVSVLTLMTFILVEPERVLWDVVAIVFAVFGLLHLCAYLIWRIFERDSND